MAFVPVSIRLGDQSEPLYSRQIELTARQLAAFEHEARDMFEPLHAIGEDLRTNIQASFGSQGATGATGRWTPLSPTYADWKAKHKPGLPILVGLRPTGPVSPGGGRNTHQTYGTSGRMMRALLAPLQDLVTWQISPTRLRYVPDSPYAGYHETGTDKMPARPPVDLTLRFLHSVDRQFVRWLAAVIKRVGL